VQRIWEVGVAGWLAGDWLSTGGILNITAVAWTAGFHWWLSGNITRTQNFSEYMLVLPRCLVCFVMCLPEWFLMFDANVIVSVFHTSSYAVH